MGRDGGLVVGGDTVVGNGRKENAGSIKNGNESELRRIGRELEELEMDVERLSSAGVNPKVHASLDKLMMKIATAAAAVPDVIDAIKYSL